MKYRKKPVVIEAIQWTGLNLEEIKDFVGESLQYNILDTAWEVGKGIPHVYMKICTLEGDHECTKGDFIIKGVNGEFYPCKPDIFEKTYEEVVKRWAESPISDSVEDNAKYYPDSLEAAAIKSAKNSKCPLLCFETINTLNGGGD